VSNLAQYLGRYAAPEARLVEPLGERYQSVLVVPAFRERPGFLQQFAAALAGARGRVLVIVVVNAAAPRAKETWPEHEALLAELRRAPAHAVSTAPPLWLSQRGAYDVLSIDRASPQHCFADKEGVGLARRIGCDVALALYARGNIASPWLYNTDADASLAPDYFTRELGVPAGVSARVFGFWHARGADEQIERATAIYEIRLRYYVLELARAGSPFAFHAIGSTLALSAPAYAAVRGFPNRLAGEDFYLLNKLAKVGPLWRDRARAVELEARASSRTAFGTGVEVARIAALADAEDVALYDPRLFSCLGAWLRVLREFADTSDVGGVWPRLRAELGQDGGVVCGVLRELGAEAELERAATQTRAVPARARHLHTWFDGFRTLKFLHALRERAFPSLPWRQALERSALLPQLDVPNAPLDELRHGLWLEEETLQPLVGPTL
jgi:hypothetical protein